MDEIKRAKEAKSIAIEKFYHAEAAMSEASVRHQDAVIAYSKARERALKAAARLDKLINNEKGD